MARPVNTVQARHNRSRARREFGGKVREIIVRLRCEGSRRRKYRGCVERLPLVTSSIQRHSDHNRQQQSKRGAAPWPRLDDDASIQARGALR